MRSNTPILSKPLPALALCATLLGGLACGNAKAATIAPTMDYTVNGTIVLLGGFSLNEDSMYLGAYYYYGAEQTGVTVAQATLTHQTTSEIDFTATVSIPQDPYDPSVAEPHGFTLIGTYPGDDVGGVCVSFNYIEEINSPWEDVFPGANEAEIHDAATTGNTGVLQEFLLEQGAPINNPIGQDASLVGFSDGQEMGNVQGVTFTPVPEPNAIPLLAGCVLLPALLLRRRTRK